MRSSSPIRRNHSFTPWLAALLLGASANAGWLIHELGEEDGEPAQVVIQIDHDHDQDCEPARTLEVEPSPREGDGHIAQRERRRARARTRHRAHDRLAARPPADFDLDLWVEQTDRYRYAIDRRALDHLAIVGFDAGAFAELDALGVLARGVTLAEPLELRNIQQGTHLWLLGLRNGDRLRGVTTSGEAALERVELELLRRGRTVSIVYELS